MFVKICYMGLSFFFIWPFCPAESCKWKQILLFYIRLPTLGVSIFFAGMILVVTVAIVVGFALNAEYFGPFVVPIVTLITYVWKNWKFSVEGEYLELKTSIIKICKEKAPPREDENISAKHTANNNELSRADRVCDFLCFCPRDTSKDPHTWESFKNLCLCWTKCTEQDGGGNGCSQHPTSERIDMSNSNTWSRSSRTTKSGKENSESAPLVSNEKGKKYSKFGKCSKSGSMSNDNNDDSNDTTTNTDTNQPSTSGNGENAELASIDENIIKFDEHGEAMISKELYEKVSNEILPLDHLLFYFFRRVIFICLYAFVMFTVMILARDSGVSESVQAINAIVGVLIPFIFDTIFADHHSPQKTCVNMATREKLEHILKVDKRENKTIFVELININNGKSPEGQEIEQGDDEGSEQSSV
jgi:hypothetical protein